MDLDSRLLGAFRALVRTLGQRVDFFAAYPCTVLKDWGDHTVDVQPDSPHLPKMERLPLDHGLPGLSVKVKKGARVLLVFSGGDPRMPRCRLFESGSLERLEFVSGLGQSILIEDDRGVTSDDAIYAGPAIEVSNAAGTIKLDHQSQNMYLSANAAVYVQTATQVHLGTGIAETPLLRVNPAGPGYIPCTNVVGT